MYVFFTRDFDDFFCGSIFFLQFSGRMWVNRNSSMCFFFHGAPLSVFFFKPTFFFARFQAGGE